MKTCLIVDDSKMIRRVAGRILEELHLQIEEAENGRVALEKCQLRMPDAILLDWRMPVMDGLSFLRELRSLKDGHVPTVILCTGQRDIQSIVQALEAGADEYVMKPFDSDILHSKFFISGVLAA